MSKPKINITTINMFIDMMHKKFSPLMQEAEVMDSVLKSKIREEAIDELGIRGKLEKKAALELALKEIKAELDGIFTDGPAYRSRPGKLDKLIDARMEQQGMTCKIREEREAVCDKIRMSILTDDMRDALLNVDETIKQLQAQVSEFRALHRAEVKALEESTEED